MADRSQYQPITVSLHLPGAAGIDEAILIDALGQVAVMAPVESVAPSRFRATFPAPEGDILDGLWKVVWGDEVATTEFTIGDGHGMTYHQVFLAGISEVTDTVHGKVDQIQGQGLIDLGLVGGPGDFRGGYLLPAPPSLGAGERFRIDDYNGGMLTLIDPVDGLIRAGDRYVITGVDPFEVRAVLDAAYALISPMARPKVVAEHLIPDGDKLTLPAGWSDVYEIWVSGKSGEERTLRFDEWSVLPRNRLRVPRSHQIQSFTVYGVREGRTPVWADSISDFPGGAVSSFVAAMLEQHRARGQATDPDAYLQRAQATLQRHGAMLRNWSGRVPNGSRSLR